jgi:DNA-binding protein H-NS
MLDPRCLSIPTLRHFLFVIASVQLIKWLAKDGENRPMALKSMSVAKLQDLREKVDAAISEKVNARREELETELSRLQRYDGHREAKATRRGGPPGPVAPKYRNPADPSQAWAGRGLQPRWLKAAIKSGKKLESFLIK